MNRMNKKTAPVIGVFLLLGALIISSCDHFYSTSWGTPRKYDPKNIKLDAGNVDSWKETAVGNPELAAALTEKIKDELKGVEQGNPNKDQAKLQDAGVSLAIEASGVGTTIVSNAGSVIDKIEQLEKDGGSNEAEVKETVKELFEDIQGDFKSNNGSKAADNLSDIVNKGLEEAPEDYTDGDKPQFPPAGNEYTEIAKPSDVGQAVIVLVLALAEENDVAANDLDFEDLSTLGITIENGHAVISTPPGASKPDPKAVTLAAYLNLIADDPSDKYSNNPITSAIKDAFIGNK